jgi:hypothetical protein
MSSAASNTRRRRAALATQPEPPVRALGNAIEAGFRKATAQAVQQAHASNVPVAILTDDNKVAWLHPDGIVRRTRTRVRRITTS